MVGVEFDQTELVVLLVFSGHDEDPLAFDESFQHCLEDVHHVVVILHVVQVLNVLSNVPGDDVFFGAPSKIISILQCLLFDK